MITLIEIASGLLIALTVCKARMSDLAYDKWWWIGGSCLAAMTLIFVWGFTATEPAAMLAVVVNSCLLMYMAWIVYVKLTELRQVSGSTTQQ